MPVGELYKRLVLFSDDELPPESYHTYYQKVKDTLKECDEDFPLTDECADLLDDAEFCIWFRKWIGNV